MSTLRARKHAARCGQNDAAIAAQQHEIRNTQNRDVNDPRPRSASQSRWESRVVHVSIPFTDGEEPLTRGRHKPPPHGRRRRAAHGVTCTALRAL
jgi:hypothetical protein